MKLAMVFPGQGSQKQGMMDGFAQVAAVRDVFRAASDALGQDLWALIASGSPEDLNATVNTQPVMLTAAYAAYRAWVAAGGPEPELMAGHSLGEYTALTAAGALAFDDTVPLVRFRAQAMQEAVPVGVGAMAVVMGLAASEVVAACAEAAQGEVVEAVNFNEPTQTVIAGARAAVDRACAAAKARGAKRALPLPVSAPFHSSLLAPAAQRLAARLEEIAIAAPKVPVIHNVDVATHDTAEEIRAALAAQAARPVRWVETVEAMVARGITHVVELGPGRVLSGLVKRIAPDLAVLSVGDGESLTASLGSLP
ncbi:MAG: ACP S-malonyltransferase [Burkholderiales bacterium]|nr:ACP S-malonyltransferase [Burkholderiales bacterium]